MVAWTWPGDGSPASCSLLFTPLTSICWERPKMKRACRLKQYLPSIHPSSQAQLHSFIPNFPTFSLFQIVQEDEELWGHSEWPHPFSLLQCGPLHGLQSFSENLLQCGPQWTTNHLENIPMLQCRVLHAEWMSSSHGLQDNTCSIIHRLQRILCSVPPPLPFRLHMSINWQILSNHTTYHDIHVL